MEYWKPKAKELRNEKQRAIITQILEHSEKLKPWEKHFVTAMFLDIDHHVFTEDQNRFLNLIRGRLP